MNLRSSWNRLSPRAEYSAARAELPDLASVEVKKIFYGIDAADSSITRLYGGIGLDLAICREAVGRRHGSITVASAPGTRIWGWLLCPGPSSSGHSVQSRAFCRTCVIP